MQALTGQSDTAHGPCKYISPYPFEAMERLIFERATPGEIHALTEEAWDKKLSVAEKLYKRLFADAIKAQRNTLANTRLFITVISNFVKFKQPQPLSALLFLILGYERLDEVNASKWIDAHPLEAHEFVGQKSAKLKQLAPFLYAEALNRLHNRPEDTAIFAKTLPGVMTCAVLPSVQAVL